MATNEQPSIAELRECRAELVRLIEGAQELGSISKELYTGECALKAVDELILELRGRNSPKSKWSYPMKTA